MQSSISPVGTCRIRYAAMAEAAGVADEKSISFTGTSNNWLWRGAMRVSFVRT
jgi:hypothetical protein